MKNRYRLLGAGLVVVALAVTLALLAPVGQDSLAQGDIVYVDAGATGANNGNSWVDAYTTLQPALGAAAANDEIWVAAGTYKPTIEYGGTGDRYKSFQLMNGVALYGGFDPDAGDVAFEDRDWALHETTLSGDLSGDDGPDFANNDENSYHVFYHPEGTELDSTAILDGFTIASGNANEYPHDDGGGMYNHSSSPALTNLTFKSNSADHTGGGMYNYSSSPALTNCTFEGNSNYSSGGGMGNRDGSSPTLTNVTFVGNSAYTGGGIYNIESSPTLTSCTFEGNWASNGGGMYNTNTSAPTLTNCSFEGNSASLNGGGICNRYSSAPTLTNCTFSTNSAEQWGGGMENGSSSPALTNCTFAGNSASFDGGGMYNELNSSPALTDCTFAGNSTGNSGGGIANDLFSSPRLSNCIFSGNSAVLDGGGMANSNSSPVLTGCTFSGNSAGYLGGGMANAYSSPALTNCILWGNTIPEIYDSNSTTIVTYSDVQGGYEGEGNIDADPLFVDAASGDMRLQLTSPAIDAGDNDAPGLDSITTDLDGHPRFVDVLSVVDTGNGDPPVVDMGAYEAPPDLILVDLEAVGDNNGTSWDDALTNLQDALAWAVDSVEIWVAAGTYKPTSGTERHASFQMKNGVALYGGFDPSVGDTAFEDRDWEANPTILSGDLNGDDGPDFANNGENSYNVFFHWEGTDLDDTAVLDGFTITGANANGSWPRDRGGGMVNIDSAPMLANVTFVGNWADSVGGGMYNRHYSYPALTNCAFVGNSAANSGGGMYNYDGSWAMLTDCTFEGNSSGWDGGGIYNSYSSPTLTNVTFTGNSAANSGGAIYNFDSWQPTLTNVTFSGNSAGNVGGGMTNRNSGPALTNCTFWGNSAGVNGGAMSGWIGSSATLINCTLWGDTSPEIYDDDSTTIVTHSNVQGGYPGVGNIEADPLFVDAASGDLRLQLTSPAIDAGDNDAPELDGITTDLGGHRRFVDVLSVADTGNGDPPIVDMGAYEAPPDLIFVDLEATGDNDGSSWEHAFTNLRDALARAVNGVEIWVAAGTYQPTHRPWPVDPRSVAFRLMNGVAIYGGFDPSVGDTAWEDRDWASNVTILSGDIGTEGDNSDNAYHVFFHPDGTDLNSTAILDGFTITGGNANGASPHDSGGGIYNYSSSPSLANLTFTGNAASGYGGGIYNWFSFPALTNCTFAGNSTGNSGGGIYNARSSPPLTNCTFEGNSAEYGGGIYNSQSSPALANCTFAGNSAVTGGGMRNAAFSSPTLTNCTFWGNSAFLGSGIYNRLSSPVLTNCILWGASLSKIYNDESSPVVTYCDIQGGYEGEGNINADPRFVDPDRGDFHLWACSPGIDAGNNDAPDLPDYDFEGDDRIVDGDGDSTATVDMGVDEVSVAGTCLHVNLPLVLRDF